MCGLCPLPEECSIPWKHLCRGHVPVDDMWALKGFLLCHTNSWRCFSNFGRCPKASLLVFRNRALFETTSDLGKQVQRSRMPRINSRVLLGLASGSAKTSGKCVVQAGKACIPLFMRAKQAIGAQSCARCFGVVSGGLYPCCLVPICLQW